jgi:putative ABC transport system permease protein
VTGSWSVARRNLLRNKRRNVATGLAIALGFAALVALGGYLFHVETYLRVYTLFAGRVGHINIYKKDGFELYSAKPRLYSLDPEDQGVINKAIGELSGLDLFGAQFQGTGLIGNGCKTLPFVSIGIEPSLERSLRQHPELKRWAPSVVGYTKGRFLDDFPDSLGALVVAEGLAQLLHKPKVHDEFPPDQKAVLIADCLAPDANEIIAKDANIQLAAGAWSGMLGALDGEIVAHYRTGLTETENTSIVAPLRHMQSLYDTQNVTSISVWLKDSKDLKETMFALQKKLRESGREFDLLPWTHEHLNPMYTGTMQFLYTLVTFIAVVLATVVVLSIFNSATMTIIERSQEIGMMRSLGFTRGKIRLLFVQEMIILAAISIVAGGILALIGISLVNGAKIDLNPPGIAGGMTLKLVPNLTTVFGASALTFGLANVTTLLAIRKILKQPITHLLMGSNR